jgi:hypothetical protein
MDMDHALRGVDIVGFFWINDIGRPVSLKSRRGIIDHWVGRVGLYTLESRPLCGQVMPVLIKLE